VPSDERVGCSRCTAVALIMCLSNSALHELMHWSDTQQSEHSTHELVYVLTRFDRLYTPAPVKYFCKNYNFPTLLKNTEF